MKPITEFELLSGEEQLLVNEIEVLTARLLMYELNLSDVRTKLQSIQSKQYVPEG
jgi:hypothetical protein